MNGVPFVDDRLRYNDFDVNGLASTAAVVDDDYLLITANTDPNGAFQTVFGPVYNTRAGLKSSQIWIDRQEAADGSGYHLYLEATPMFIMNPEGIADMKVTN